MTLTHRIYRFRPIINIFNQKKQRTTKFVIRSFLNIGKQKTWTISRFTSISNYTQFIFFHFHHKKGRFLIRLSEVENSLVLNNNHMMYLIFFVSFSFGCIPSQLWLKVTIARMLKEWKGPNMFKISHVSEYN